MLAIISQLHYWLWFIIAAVLLIIELMMNSGYLLAISAAAIATGIFTWLMTTVSVSTQAIFFMIYAGVFCILWFVRLKKSPLKSTEDL